MFASTIQPPVVSLFSSAGSDPLQLFSKSTDPALTSDSFVHFLNDQTSLPPPDPEAQLIALPESSSSSELNSLSCTVLHLQSPTIKTTFIRSPPDPKKSLGLTHPWFHIQFRDLGREFCFEIGMTDVSGRASVLRCSTFQDEPRIEHLSPPLLHVPLSITPSDATTPWRTLSINLPTVVPHFSSSLCTVQGRRPSVGKFASVAYVKVCANCRLRRVWFTRSSDGGKDWEFGLYTCER